MLTLFLLDCFIHLKHAYTSRSLSFVISNSSNHMFEQIQKMCTNLPLYFLVGKCKGYMSKNKLIRHSEDRKRIAESQYTSDIWIQNRKESQHKMFDLFK